MNNVSALNASSWAPRCRHFYSSGDSGVAGNGGQCVDNFTNHDRGSNGIFSSSFFPHMPVGATQIAAGGSATQLEAAYPSVIASGGGATTSHSQVTKRKPCKTGSSTYITLFGTSAATPAFVSIIMRCVSTSTKPRLASSTRRCTSICRS